MARVPRLRRHAHGLWMTVWASRYHYFTRDRAESERLFLDPASDHPGSLRRWHEWRALRAGVGRRTPPAAARITVAELVLAFLASYADARRLRAERYYRATLRRFVAVFGRFFCDEVTEVLIAAHAKDLSKLKLAPKTIAHQINAVRTLWGWASDPVQGLARPLALKRVRGPDVPDSEPNEMRPEQVRDAVRKLEKINPPLAAWAAVSYLCACRPTEVARLAYGQGHWRTIPPGDDGPAVVDGVIELKRHKTSRGSKSRAKKRPRMVVVTDEALAWVRVLRPLATRRARRSPMETEDDVHLLHVQNAYARACRLAGFPALPSRLRDSAASHLLARGVDEVTVARLLGHAPPGELPRYGRTALLLLRVAASRLTLR